MSDGIRDSVIDALEKGLEKASGQGKKAGEVSSDGINEMSEDDKHEINVKMGPIVEPIGDPVVEGAVVTCDKKRVFSNLSVKKVIVKSTHSYGVKRNGKTVLTEIDIKLVPSTFGECKIKEGCPSSCEPEIFGEKWSECTEEDLIRGKMVVNMDSYMTCKCGGVITIEENGQIPADGEESAEEAYKVMERWLLGGYDAVSEDQLTDAMKQLVKYGDQKEILSLNEVAKVTDEMDERINDDLERQDQYDYMILAWSNFWNMNMEKEYGNDFVPIRAEVIKAMAVVESDMGKENMISTVLANGQRDILQSLDPENPVIWAVLNVEPKGTIDIIIADEDSKRLDIDGKREKNTGSSGGGDGLKKFFGNGTWKAASELISDDCSEYYAGNVTPSLSIAVGEAYYCMQLNGAGSNEGKSVLRKEESSVYRYNGGGDKEYVRKVNCVLENMGADELEG